MIHVAIRSHLFRSNIFLKKEHGQMTVESKINTSSRFQIYPSPIQGKDLVPSSKKQVLVPLL